MTQVMEFNKAKQEAFSGKLVDMFNLSGMALMTSIGHRTGLFDVMARLAPSTSVEIAEAAGLNERYVREWLGAMVTGGFIEHDPALKTYHLPPEHASLLTRDAAPNNLAVTAQFIAVLGEVEDRVIDCFKKGGGVPYSAYHRFHDVMAEESFQTIVSGLKDIILPLVPDVQAALERGIDVLDVGCGSGRAMNALAKHYPNSRFAGYDLSEETIANARREAQQSGLKNVQFEVKDLSTLDQAKQYDLITAFDAIHDQPKPDYVLSWVYGALKPDGTFFMQDIAGSSHVHNNMEHPVAAFLYTISCMHCMSVSLAQDGAGLGAMWGKEKAIEMLQAAGFNNINVQSLEHDVMNYYYIVKKA